MQRETESPIHREREGEKLGDQLHTYLVHFYTGLKGLSPAAEEYFPGASNIQAELIRHGEIHGEEIIRRNNHIADVTRKSEVRRSVEKQRAQSGNCAQKFSGCIDGRYSWAHSIGMNAGIWEVMAGVTPTYKSEIDGKTRLRSESLTQTVIDRPKRTNSTLLAWYLAHKSFFYKLGDCGAMRRWQALREAAGNPFATDDLVKENLDLFEPGIQTMTRLYNTSAREVGVPTLKKVAIKGVLDTDTQGILLGYGEENPLFTTTMLKEYSEKYDLPKLIAAHAFDDPRYRIPGYFRNNFTDWTKFAEKEEMITEIAGFLRNFDPFEKDMDQFSQTLQELDGLSVVQLHGLYFTIARTMAHQYVTGLYEINAHETHHFSGHRETYQSIAMDDGIAVTVGQLDPEVQAFGACVSSIDEAIDHMETQTALMTSHGEQKPYILFISSAIAEETKSTEALKQARSNLARSFWRILERPEVLEKVRNGELIIIPAIIESGTRKIKEVPNLCL